MSPADNQPYYLTFLFSLPVGAKILVTIIILAFSLLLIWLLWWPPQSQKIASVAVAEAAIPTRAIEHHSADPFQWDQHWGTTTRRADGTIYLSALQIRTRNVSDKPVVLKDAFLTSGKTGEVLKMEVDAGPDGWLPPSNINSVPPNAVIVLRAQFGLPSGLSAEAFMRNWGIITLVAHYDDHEYRRTFDEKEISSIFAGFGVYPLGPRVSKKEQSRR